MKKEKKTRTLEEQETIRYQAKRLIPDLIIIPLVILVIIYVVISNMKLDRQYEQQLAALSCLEVGSSKSSIEEHLEQPAHTVTRDSYELCTFTSDVYVVQTAYDSAGTLRAYLVTELDNRDSQVVTVGGFPMGDSSFYDYPGKPNQVSGYVSQGVARCLYAEQYSTDVENDWLIVLDFGRLSVTLPEFVQSVQLGVEKVDDEVEMAIVTSPQTLADRKQICPNTYGASDVSIGMDEMYNLFFLYNNFDSLSMREDRK